MKEITCAFIEKAIIICLFVLVIFVTGKMIDNYYNSEHAIRYELKEALTQGLANGTIDYDDYIIKVREVKYLPFKSLLSIELDVYSKQQWYMDYFNNAE